MTKVFLLKRYFCGIYLCILKAQSSSCSFANYNCSIVHTIIIIMMIIIIIIIIITFIFKEDNVFGMIVNLPYDPPMNTSDFSCNITH